MLQRLSGLAFPFCRVPTRPSSRAEGIGNAGSLGCMVVVVGHRRVGVTDELIFLQTERQVGSRGYFALRAVVSARVNFRFYCFYLETAGLAGSLVSCQCVVPPPRSGGCPASGSSPRRRAGVWAAAPALLQRVRVTGWTGWCSSVIHDFFSARAGAEIFSRSAAMRRARARGEDCHARNFRMIFFRARP